MTDVVRTLMHSNFQYQFQSRIALPCSWSLVFLVVFFLMTTPVHMLPHAHLHQWRLTAHTLLARRHLSMFQSLRVFHTFCFEWMCLFISQNAPCDSSRLQSQEHACCQFSRYKKKYRLRSCTQANVHQGIAGGVNKQFEAILQKYKGVVILETRLVIDGGGMKEQDFQVRART